MLLTRILKSIAFSAVLVGSLVLFAVNPVQAGPGDTVNVSRSGNGEVTINIFEGDQTSQYDTFEYYEITRRLNGNQQLTYVAGEDMMPRGVPTWIDTPPNYNAEYLYDVWGTTFVGPCDSGDPQCNPEQQESYYARVYKIGSATLPAQAPPRTCTTEFNIGLNFDMNGTEGSVGNLFTVAAEVNGNLYEGTELSGSKQYRFSIPPAEFGQSNFKNFDIRITSSVPNFTFDKMQESLTSVQSVEYCPSTMRTYYADINAVVYNDIRFNSGSNAQHQAGTLNIQTKFNQYNPGHNPGTNTTYGSIYNQSVTGNTSFTFDQLQYHIDRGYTSDSTASYPARYKLDLGNLSSATATVYRPNGNIRGTYTAPFTDIQIYAADTIVWDITTPEVQQTVTGKITAEFLACDSNNVCNQSTFNENLYVRDSNNTDWFTLDIQTNSTNNVDFNANEIIKLVATNNSGRFSKIKSSGRVSNTQTLECTTNGIANSSSCVSPTAKGGLKDQVKNFASSIWRSITGESDESTFVTLMEFTAEDLTANGGAITVTAEYYAIEDPDFSLSLNPTSRTFTSSGQTQCFAVMVTPQNGFDKTRVNLTAASVDPSFTYSKTDAFLSESGNSYDNGEVCFTLNSDRADFSDVVYIHGSASGVRRTNPNTGAVTYETVTRNRPVTLILDNAKSAVIEARLPGGQWVSGNSATFTSNSRNVEIRAKNVKGFDGSCTDVMFGRNGQIFDATVVPSHNGTTAAVSSTTTNFGQPSTDFTVTCDGGPAIGSIAVTVNQPTPNPSGQIRVKGADNNWRTANPTTITQNSNSITIGGTSIANCSEEVYFYDGTSIFDPDGGLFDYTDPQVTVTQNFGTTRTYEIFCDQDPMDSIRVTLNQPSSPTGVLEVKRIDSTWDNTSPSTIYGNSETVTLRTTNLQNCSSSRVDYYRGSSYVGSSNNSTNNYEVSLAHTYGATHTYHARCNGQSSNFSSHQVTLREPDFVMSLNPNSLSFNSVGQQQCFDIIVARTGGFEGTVTMSGPNVPSGFSVTSTNSSTGSGDNGQVCFTYNGGLSNGNVGATVAGTGSPNGSSSTDSRSVTLNVNITPPEPSGTLQVQHPTNGWSDSPSAWNASATTFNIRTRNVQNCSQQLYYKRQGTSTTLATRSTPDYNAQLANPAHGTSYTYTVQCGSSGSVFDTIDVTINQLASPTGTLEVKNQDGSWDSNSPTTVYNSASQVTLRTTNLQNCGSGRVDYYRGSSYVTNSTNASNNYEVLLPQSHGTTSTYHSKCGGSSSNMSSHQVTLQAPDYSVSFSPTNLNYTAVGQKQCVDVVVIPQNGYSEDLILSSGSVPAFVSTSFDNGLYYRANEYNSGVTKTICFTLDSEPPRNDTFTVTANTSEFSPTENTESRSINLNVNITPDPTGTIQAQDNNNNNWHSSSLIYESNSRNFNLRSINVVNCSDNLVYRRSGSSESQTTGPASGGTGPTVGFTVPAFGQTYTYTVHCGSSINSMSQVNVRINEAVSTVDTDQHVYSQTTSGSAIQSSWNATVRIDSANTAVNGSNQTMNSRVITANDPDTGTTSFTLSGVTPPSGYIFDSVQVYSGPPGRGSCGSPSSRTTTSLNDTLSWTGKCNLTAFVKFAPNPIVDYTVTTRVVDVNGDPVVADWQNSVSVGSQSENRSVNNNSSSFITLSVPQSDPNSSSYSISSLDFPNNYVFGPSSSIRVGNPTDGCSYRTSNNPSASFNWSSKCDLVATVTLEKAPNYEISIDPEITVIAGVTGDQCTTLTIQTDENTTGTVTVDFNFDSNNDDTNAVTVNYDSSFTVTSSRTYQKPVCFEIDERIGRGRYGYRIDTNSDIVGGDGNTVRHNVSGTLDVKNIPDGSVTEN